MKTFKRTFVLRESAISKKLWLMLIDFVLTHNSAKVGRHRRGQLILSSWTSSRTESNHLLLDLIFTYHRRRKYDWRRLKKSCKTMGMKVNRYGFADHNKLLKVLTEASVR